MLCLLFLSSLELVRPVNNFFILDILNIRFSDNGIINSFSPENINLYKSGFVFYKYLLFCKRMSSFN